MTLIRELISIPTQVQDGDFVLKLTQGISPEVARQTVRDYVVTDQLAGAFDQALGLVASAVVDRSSKAAFLQGSFGSGKSHFMAILHLLLSGDKNAREMPALHAAIDKWSKTLDGGDFLLVPVHFLEAKSMEQVILGGYIDQIQRLHPEAGLPSVFLGDEIMATELPNLRARIGDEALLAGLNGSVDAEEWGDFAAAWTSEALDAALAAPATDLQRLELVTAYVSAFRQGTVLEGATTGRGYIDLDRGLAAISTHAETVGYDGVVLFLDELILWLASNIGNMNFVQGESQKLTKLVEATAAGRPVPIISFIARQRDLRELVGDHIAGNEMRSFADNLELQQGRFSHIELAAGNLPQIVKQRLLTPVDDGAAVALSSAVDTALVGRDDVKRMLAGSDADLQMFRDVYPFSPALVEALVDVSEALQRERTALKVMLQLLVDQRDTLELGSFIPVGDLWDVISSRDEPFSNELKKLFETAKSMWRTKLYPALVSINNVTEATPADAPERKALANDSRLLKTVLLAALVPEIEAFRGLDAARLAALNWGSIVSPIPGSETQLVAAKLRRLTPLVGELLVGENPVNPTVGIRLADVDTDDILTRGAQTFDNAGARRQKIRELIAAALDHRIGDDLRGTLHHEWRGTIRAFDVVFGNVRDAESMTDATLTASGDRPKLIIDFPFDDVGRSPEDDLERLDAWGERHHPSTTVCWLPSFFNAHGLSALGRYVTAEELMKRDDRFDQYTQHLSPNQRTEAKLIIEGVRTQLRGLLSDAILAAYGVTSTANSWVDPANSLNDHYRSLDPSLVIRPLVQPTLPGALGELCDQVLANLYPGHPTFDLRVTPAHLRTTWAEVRRALADAEGRVLIEASHRQALRTVANGLALGTMSESAFTIGDFWRNQLDRHLTDHANRGVHATVDDVRAWIDQAPGGPRGLDPAVADLVIMTVAAQSDHRLVHRGATFDPDASKAMPGDVVLVPEILPDQELWLSAVARAAEIFGITVQPRITGPELASLANKVRAAAPPLAAPAEALVAQLSEVYPQWGLGEGNRLATAMASRDLVKALAHAEDHDVVVLLAGFEAPTSDRAAGKSLSTASTVTEALRRANMTLWVAARSAVEADVRAVLLADEVVTGFEAEAIKIETAATKFVAGGLPGRSFSEPREPGDSGPGTSTPEGPSDVPVRSGTRQVTVNSREDLDQTLAELREAFASHGRLELTWSAGDLEGREP